MSRHDLDVLIVGGGIGGLASALALSRAGLRVRVLEQAPEFGEVGAGLQISPNCTRILRTWGLLDEVISLGVLPRRIVMKDALDGEVLTWLDLADVERRYGAPYVVIHRTDLHGVLLQACRRGGVDLVTNAQVTAYENRAGGAAVTVAGERQSAPLVLAADGLHSTARETLVGDAPVNSAYVAYRGTVPVSEVDPAEVSLQDVVVYIGPHRHFVQYPLRRGEILNQVAVFRSPRALAGEPDWGAPDELEAGFAGSCAPVRRGLTRMWRDRWWRMFDRDPIASYVYGRIALTGDAAHPPLQYLAQGAVMAIEDAWVLAEHVRARTRDGEPDWDAALAAYDAVRPEHCRRVVLGARDWGDLWHRTGQERQWRNQVLRARDVYDYRYIDWLYGPTALRPEQEPPRYPDEKLSELVQG